MQLPSMKIVLAALWVSLAVVAGVAGNLSSPWSWTALAVAAVGPPVILMWRWSDPQQSLSESIQEARR